MIDLHETETQYLFWWLGRTPSQIDFKNIMSILHNNKTIFIKTAHNSVEYRKSYDDSVSLHIILIRKFWGVAVNAHIDVGIHSKALFTKDSLELLSRIYIFLKKKRYGKCFLLPREERNFRKFRNKQ